MSTTPFLSFLPLKKETVLSLFGSHMCFTFYTFVELVLSYESRKSDVCSYSSTAVKPDHKCIQCVLVSKMSSWTSCHVWCAERLSYTFQ